MRLEWILLYDQVPVIIPNHLFSDDSGGGKGLRHCNRAILSVDADGDRFILSGSAHRQAGAEPSRTCVICRLVTGKMVLGKLCAYAAFVLFFLQMSVTRWLIKCA